MLDAEHGAESDPGARRRGGVLLTVAAVLLVLAGGAAAAVGLLGQDPSPPSPRAAGKLASEPVSKAAATQGTDGSPAPPAARDPALRPVRIRIPAIGVSSPLIALGLNADRSLQVPQPGPDYDKAEWFSRSPAPGQLGPAVIEGHVDGRPSSTDWVLCGQESE